VAGSAACACCEAVGELDHDHAQVARHRDEHLAEVLGLPLLADENASLPIFVTPSTSSAISLPTRARDPPSCVRVLDDVVQEPASPW